MGLAILLALVVVPLVEIAVFISVGGAIGLWPTIAIVVLTAIAGTIMLRQQGLATLMRARQALAQQRMPVQELFDGACLLVAGVLLLTPGFVTDTIGFVLMIPPLRAFVGRWLWRAAEKSSRIHRSGDPNQGKGSGPMGGGGHVIEGDYRTVEPEAGPPAASKWGRQDSDDDETERNRGPHQNK